MKTLNSSLLFIFALSISTGANAAGSMLRVTCEGDDVGAEVQINGKFKGECPVDIQIKEGTYKLRVEKKDASYERVFEQDIRMGDGVVKKVEAVLTTRLNAAAQKREEQRLAVEEAEVAKLEAKRQEERLRVEAQNRVESDAAWAMLRKQGVEAGNGKPFRDCPDCPEIVAIPPGSFEMGSTNGYPDEKPVHHVNISHAFAMGKTEVTQGQWKAIMGNNPSLFQNCGDNCPVESVSWDDAKEFIQKLNAKTGKQYRLPSESEWEYACRAGGRQEYCGSGNLDSVGWYNDNSGGGWLSNGTTHPVANKQANVWGLHDMSGNVWEWVEDNYHADYNGAPTNGSAWSGAGGRVICGGSWGNIPDVARAAARLGVGPVSRVNYIGFRLARMLP